LKCSSSTRDNIILRWRLYILYYTQIVIFWKFRITKKIENIINTKRIKLQAKTWSGLNLVYLRPRKPLSDYKIYEINYLILPRRVVNIAIPFIDR